MDKIEAEKIVNEYGGVLASEAKAARRKSLLPCSKGKIKFAFYAYVKSLIDHFGSIEPNLKNALVQGYAAIDSFIDDKEAKEMNTLGKKLQNNELDNKVPEDKKMINKYFAFVNATTFNTKARSEIEEFIIECMEK